jgi:hypothetical protein
MTALLDQNLYRLVLESLPVGVCVVITMGALGGPPEEIGHKVAAALVGTLLGILLCYGFVGLIAANMAKNTEDQHAFYHVLRVVIVSFIKGSPPSIAVEFGRRAIPGHVRPSFQEMEKYLKGGSDAAAAVPEAAVPAARARPCPRLLPSSSRKKQPTLGIMVALGKWLMPIS